MSTATYDLLDRLQGEEVECSYECSAMLLGILTKELKKYGVLSRSHPELFYRFSIGGLKGMIKGYKVPEWLDINYYSGSVHSCTIQQKLSLALKTAEDDLRTFTLWDFC